MLLIEQVDGDGREQNMNTTSYAFCLFLFYVASLTCWGFIMAYKVAWKEGMIHVGLLVPIIPSMGAKEYIQTKYFMSEA